MIYFTSDLHLGHEAVIRMQNRPFTNADEMNRVLIENYNSAVHKDDTVYLLGDICFRIGVEKANELIAALISHGVYKPDSLTAYLEEIRQAVKFKKWFFGHYHDNRNVNVEEILLWEQIIRIS